MCVGGIVTGFPVTMPPPGLGLDLRAFANPCKTVEIGSEGSGLELAVTGASALVAAACIWWTMDEANCSGRFGRQFMKRKFFGAAADSQKSDFRGRTK